MPRTPATDNPATKPLPYRLQGYFVGDRPNAEASIDAATTALIALNEARQSLAADTVGNAIRLNDFVRDAKRYLANAERFLDQRADAQSAGV